MKNYDQFVHGILEEEEDESVTALKNFVKTFNESKEEATAALIRTGVLNPDGSPKDHICEYNFFEMKIEPLKTFTFLRDWFFNDRYNLQPIRSGISADGDPFLVYRPKHPKKTDIKEIYIETYEGDICIVVYTAVFDPIIKCFYSLEEFCKYIDGISKYLT